MERAAMAKRSPARNFLTWGFHILVTTVAGSRIRDTQCGFKLFTRRAASLLFPNQRLQRWCFDVEILYLSDQLDIPVSEVPVQWTEIPGSKIRAFTIIDMAFELFTLKLAYQILGLFIIDLFPNLQLPKSDK
jgi:dolichyl-phosphate beta-glucosyltransferase